MAVDPNCIFCNIASGEVPASVVYEDDATLAFLDIKPHNPGHALVIPKEHHADIHETPEATLSRMMATVQNISRALVSGLGARGINISMNNAAAAGQDVFHAHIHVIPRFEGDNFKHWPQKKYAPGEAEQVAEKIRGAL